MGYGSLGDVRTSSVGSEEFATLDEAVTYIEANPEVVGEDYIIQADTTVPVYTVRYNMDV